MNTPPAKAGGFGLRVEAKSIGRMVDCPLSQRWERAQLHHGQIRGTTAPCGDNAICFCRGPLHSPCHVPGRLLH